MERLSRAGIVAAVAALLGILSASAAPGQTQECEAGNERYIAGRTIIGNEPGNQGLRTQGQRPPPRGGGR